MKTTRFNNINYIVNANATPMADNSTWIQWTNNLLKKGHSKKSINRIAKILNQ